MAAPRSRQEPSPPALLRIAAALRVVRPREARALVEAARQHPRWQLSDAAERGVLTAGALDDARALADDLGDGEQVPSEPEALRAWAREAGLEYALDFRLRPDVSLADAATGVTASGSSLSVRERGDMLVQARGRLSDEADAARRWTQAPIAGELSAQLAARVGDDASRLPLRSGDVCVDASAQVAIWQDRADGASVRCSLFVPARVECDRCGADDSADHGGACVHRVDALNAIRDLIAWPTDAERRVLDAAAATAPWDRALRTLAGEPPAPRSPFSWRVTDGEAGPALEPRRSGRRCSARAVLEDAQASPADRQAALLLRGGEDRETVASALWSLADGGVARDAKGQALRLLRGANELLVEDVEGGFAVSLAVDGHRLPADADPCSATVLQRDDRVVITRAAPHLRGLAQAVHELPDVFPVEARDLLLLRVVGLEQRLPVRLPSALEGARVTADSQLAVRVAPTRRGMRVEIGVHAVAGATFIAPAEGPDEVSGLRDGRRIRALRDRDAERRLAHGLVARIGLRDHERVDGWVWFIEDATRAAAILDELSRVPDVEVEHPDGLSAHAPSRPAEIDDLAISVRKGRDWFALTGEVRVDEHAVGLQRLLEAAREHRRYVPLESGRFLELSDTLLARLEAASIVVHEHGNQLRAGRTAAPLLDEALFGDGVPSASAGFEEVVESVQAARDLEIAVPAELRAQLRPYQQEAFAWLARLTSWGAGACLADEMGLGKTVMALTLLLHRRRQGPALVVAPTSVCFNWAREAARFAPDLRVVTPSAAQRREALCNATAGDLIIVSYGALIADEELFGEVQLATVILDEAQAIKNPQTRRARAVRRLQADAIVALTGTPVENHLGELWSLFSVLCPSLLGSWASFFHRFAAPIERDDDKPGAERAAAQLRRLVRPFLLRRTKSEVAAELPPRTEVDVHITPSEDERALYEAVRRHLELEVAEQATRGPDAARMQVLAALTRLRRLACHPRLDDPASEVASAKLTRALEFVDEIVESGGRALVFSQFTSHLALLREALSERSLDYAYLDGSTPAAERARQVDAFQSGSMPLFLVSLKAGGTGLNLTAADYVLHLDPWWNPAVEDQATDRAHRIGQTRPVTVYRLITAGTIEEHVVALHRDKRRLAAAVVGEATTALTIDEMQVLLRPTPRL